QQTPQPRVPADQVQREGGVAGKVAVADEHGDVGGEPFGAERGGGEGGGHGEEDHGAAVGGGEHRPVLAAGYVHADHREVGTVTAERVPDRLGDCDRVPGVCLHHGVGEAGGDQPFPLRLVGHHAHRGRGAGGPGRGQRE